MAFDSAGRVGALLIFVIGVVQLVSKGLAWQRAVEREEPPRHILYEPRSTEQQTREIRAESAPAPAACDGGNMFDPPSPPDPGPVHPVAPWSPQWRNSVAICTTMRGENLTDVREWLDYYRCGCLYVRALYTAPVLDGGRAGTQRLVCQSLPVQCQRLGSAARMTMFAMLCRVAI